MIEFIRKYTYKDDNDIIKNKFYELEGKICLYKGKHIRFSRDGKIFYIKFNSKTQHEVASKSFLIESGISNDNTWYADFKEESGEVIEKMTKIEFNDSTQLLDFLKAIGLLYQTVASKVLDFNVDIENATLETIDDIVIPFNPIAQADIGVFDSAV